MSCATKTATSVVPINYLLHCLLQFLENRTLSLAFYYLINQLFSVGLGLKVLMIILYLIKSFYDYFLNTSLG